MSNIEKMIRWMTDRKGKVTYSMDTRLGPNSYDCSSAVYFALISGDFLPIGTMGNTDTLFTHLGKSGWIQVQADVSGNYPVKKGDIFIWGNQGSSGGAAGHTGIFMDHQGTIIHCNYGYNGITINDHDTIWRLNDCPAITIYRYSKDENNHQKPQPNTPEPIPVPQKQQAGLIPMKGIFYPDRRLAVSKDTNPDDTISPALDYYLPNMSINYDHYIHSNGYVWISYLNYDAKRRYVAVGPDDDQTDTTWGTGFFN
ncbi:peptidoglycan amidohydrolase family protein [Candidatus Enterococcus ikei]|uniref:SH3 domain-containing protein n=1 Tax=Candidatus Enterococcus ikei TaxID=2815326 RepID=A0ABS3H3A2_9ENTE|nr:peptidoglycan amidohydrolase family protein [Enterococcus sp. DIV0869a]MBO0441674.1 SH3 domain-containing protein [Enterococcus sp. DIV0869a]